jgi:hypothetical protein
MPREAKQSQDYKFNVVQLQLRHPVTNAPIKQYGNFREDTGACLGVTSDEYGIMQNNDLLSAAVAALEARGLKDYKQKVIVTGEGERMYASFSFANKQIANAVGDIFGYTLTLKNSFDRSLKAALALGFLRLTCLNGASTIEKEFAINRKHSSSISPEFVGAAIDQALANGQKALGVFDKLAATGITDEQGVNVLKQLEAAKLLSGTLRQSMETLWLAPRRAEDKARNLYNLYNAVSEHLTHQVAESRFEYANEVNNSVLLKLFNAARKPEYLGKLILPLPTSDDVTVTVDTAQIAQAAGGTSGIIIP